MIAIKRRASVSPEFYYHENQPEKIEILHGQLKSYAQDCDGRTGWFYVVLIPCEHCGCIHEYQWDSPILTGKHHELHASQCTSPDSPHYQKNILLTVM